MMCSKHDFYFARKKKFTKETALTASHLGLVRAAKQFITRRAIMQESKSYYKKGSAFNADNAPILSPGKLFLDEIRKSDPYDLKKITTEIRLKDGWNDATNDNLHNSHYNKVERKNADSYNEPKSFETSYLKQCSIVNQSISATPSMLVNPKFGRQAYAVEVKDSRPHSAAPRLTSRNDSGQLSSIEKTKNEVDSDNDRERLKKLAAIKRNVSFTYKVDHSELASGMLEASSHQLSLVRPLSAPEVLPVKKEKEQEQEQQLENVQLPEITPASEEQIKSLGWRRPSMSAAYQERKKSQGLLTNQEHHRIDRLRKCSSASSRATRFGRSSLYSHTIAESTDDNNDIWYDTMNENSIQYVLPTPDDIAYEKLREIGIEDDSHEEHFSIRQSLLSQQVFRLKEEEDIPENICLDYLVRIIDIGYDLPAAKKTKIIRYDSRRSIDIMDDEIIVKSVNESGSYDSEDSEDESDLALPSTLGIVIESAPLVKNTGKRKSESEYLVNVYDEKNIRHLFIPIARLYDLSVNTGHIEIQNMLFEMRSLCYFYRGSQQLDVHNRYHKTKSTSDLLSTIGIDTAAPKSPGKEENETRGKRSKFSKPKLKRHRSTKELTTFKDEDRHDVIYPPLLSMFDKDLENELINMIYENMELTFDYFKRRVVVDLIK